VTVTVISIAFALGALYGFFAVKLDMYLRASRRAEEELVSRTVSEIRSMKDEMHTINEDLARYLANRDARR
jgi:methionine salvage enolase-phosphatase E1